MAVMYVFLPESIDYTSITLDFGNVMLYFLCTSIETPDQISKMAENCLSQFGDYLRSSVTVNSIRVKAQQIPTEKEGVEVFKVS